MKRPLLQSKKRKGAVAVEFALVLPIIFLFFFGLWEWSRVEMVKHVNETAIFQAARTGSLPGATTEDVEAAAETIFNRYMIREWTVDALFSETETSVECSVPLDANTWVSSFFFKGKEVSGHMTFPKQ